jgi:hypothetical protein
MIEECVHGLEYGCTLCSGKASAERKLLEREQSMASRPFTAKYDGSCTGCSLPIMAGKSTIVLKRQRAYHSGCE